MNNLNKRDLESYKRLVEQINNGFGDKYLNFYVPVLLNFIARYYRSDNSKIFELDDFIQECLIKINEVKNDNLDIIYNIGLVEVNIYKVFKDMNLDKNLQVTEPIYINRKYVEIDIDKLDLEKKEETIVEPSKEDENSRFYSSYKSFLLKKANSRIIIKLLKKYWTDSLKFDINDYNYYSSQIGSLLDFFTDIKRNCDMSEIMFLSNIDEDINKLIYMIDITDNKMNITNKQKLKKYIKLKYINKKGD